MSKNISEKSARRIRGVVRRIEQTPHDVSGANQRKKYLRRQLPAGSAEMTFIKITAKVGYNQYTVSVYDNGPDQTATATGQTAKIPQIASSETVPNDSWFSAVVVGSTYWFQPPIWDK